MSFTGGDTMRDLSASAVLNNAAPHTNNRFGSPLPPTLSEPSWWFSLADSGARKEGVCGL